MLADTSASTYANGVGLDTACIKWTGGFWKEVVDICARNMVPNLKAMFENKDISHVVENFRIAAGQLDGDFCGTVFGDGDFYKWMEAELYAAYLLQDASRFSALDDYITLIGSAQQADGYISTKQIIEDRQGRTRTRLKDVNEFEVYNMGHLLTSAALHKRLTGKDNFLKIARKAAEYLGKMYEKAEENKDVQTAVCPSHYMGLIELYRTTGETQYLNLAKRAIELRDLVKDGTDDNQDRIPLKQQNKIVGHAVRATYLYAGVADYFLESGDEGYLTTLNAVWRNMADTKLYLTGGVGALYNGCSPYGDFFTDQRVHQAFGYEYQLPNITAYNETCASVGLVMWAYRMFLVRPDSEYFDLIERALLNVNLAAVSLDGKKYFYENMLRRTRHLDVKLIWPLTRTSYIYSYCCPPNLARLIMQSSEYCFVQKGDRIYTGLFGEAEAKITLKNGSQFLLKEKTKYPYYGDIEFSFRDVQKDKGMDFMLRIPDWCDQALIQIFRGETLLSERKILKKSGYEKISLDKIRDIRLKVSLSMSPRYTVANAMVEENGNQVAVERGPLVYCIESVDVGNIHLEDIYLDPSEELRPKDIRIGDRRLVALEGKAALAQYAGDSREELYYSYQKPQWRAEEIRLIPYFAWDNRGSGEMRIWMPCFQR